MKGMDNLIQNTLAKMFDINVFKQMIEGTVNAISERFNKTDAKIEELSSKLDEISIRLASWEDRAATFADENEMRPMYHKGIEDLSPLQREAFNVANPAFVISGAIDGYPLVPAINLENHDRTLQGLAPKPSNGNGFDGDVS